MNRMRWMKSGLRFSSQLAASTRSRAHRQTLALGGAVGGAVFLVAAAVYKRGTAAECEINDSPPSQLCAEVDLQQQQQQLDLRLRQAQNSSVELIEALMDKCGSPGLSIAVNVDGQPAMRMGFGYADVENGVRCSPDTVMRIASIGKTLVMAIAGKLLQTGDLDLDRDVREYVKTWPQKTYDNKNVTITMRMLLSHLSGIRHYDRTCANKYPNNSKDTDAEVYSSKPYKDTTEALTMFKDDDLCSKPGTEFMYTTHGWTLVSAVLESITGKSFEKLVTSLLQDLSMKNTYLDKNDPIITNRARFYTRRGKGTLINSPYVDPSYKYSGGGLLSSVVDVITFGDVMLYSFQSRRGDEKAYLKAETMKQMWTPVEASKCSWDREGKTGLTWGVVPEHQVYGGGRSTRFYASHTGGGIGSSSVLLILPRSDPATAATTTATTAATTTDNPKGVTVAILTNMQSVALNNLAKKIAFLYADATTAAAAVDT